MALFPGLNIKLRAGESSKHAVVTTGINFSLEDDGVAFRIGTSVDVSNTQQIVGDFQKLLRYAKANLASASSASPFSMPLGGSDNSIITTGHSPVLITLLVGADISNDDQSHYLEITGRQILNVLLERERFKFNPVDLFLGGEAGVLYDFSTSAYMAQNSDGTGPVANVGDPVGYLADLSGNDVFAIQPIAAARPILGRFPRGVSAARRNLLTSVHDFTSGVWLLGSSNVTSTKRFIRFAGVSVENFRQQIIRPTDGEQVTFRCGIRLVSGTGSYRVLLQELDNGGGFLGQSISPTITPTNSDVQFIEFSRTGNQASGNIWQFVLQRVADNTPSNNDTVELIKPQLELGASSTPFQDWRAPWDVQEDGRESIQWLYFDGIDDHLIATGVDLSGTDQLTVSAVSLVSENPSSAERLFSHKDESPSALEMFRSISGQLNFRVGGTVEKFPTIALPNVHVPSWQIATANISSGSVVHRTSAGDATLAGLGTGTFAQNDLVIGARNDLSSAFFYEGFIGHLMICSREIVPDEWVRHRNHLIGLL